MHSLRGNPRPPASLLPRHSLLRDCQALFGPGPGPVSPSLGSPLEGLLRKVLAPWIPSLAFCHPFFSCPHCSSNKTISPAPLHCPALFFGRFLWKEGGTEFRGFGKMVTKGIIKVLLLSSELLSSFPALLCWDHLFFKTHTHTYF